jgi:prepilin-type N-terminal cleavage/methylation domain-containing protein
MRTPRARAFTLVELLVVIGIIAVLIGILIPVLGRARDQANKTACMSNIRQVMIGFTMYANNNKDKCPFGARLDNPGGVDLPEDWVHWRQGINGEGLNSSAIAPFLSGKGEGLKNILRCPSDRGEDRITSTTGQYAYSFTMNMYFEPREGFYPAEGGPPIRLSATKAAAEKILLAEENERTINDGFWAPGNYAGGMSPTDPVAGWVVNWDWLSIRHDNSKKESEPAMSTGPLNMLPNLYRSGVVCFADGHVDFVTRKYAHSPTHLLPRMQP